MAEDTTTKREGAAKPVGPSKREKIITAVIAIAFIAIVVTVALVQKANGF